MVVYIITVLLGRGISDLCLHGGSYVSKTSQTHKRTTRKSMGYAQGTRDL